MHLVTLAASFQSFLKLNKRPAKIAHLNFFLAISGVVNQRNFTIL
jgi:hypothetical protein